MTEHRRDYRGWKNGKQSPTLTSFIIFDKYGLDNCSICLIENANSSTKEELQRRERFHIENTPCINKYIPMRTKKEWIKSNLENIRNQTKRYYESNYSKITEYQRQYRAENKDKMQEYKRQLYLETREETLVQQKLNRDNDLATMCNCGGSYKAYRKSIHFKTKKHQAFICQSIL